MSKTVTIDPFEEAKNATYRSDYKRIVDNALSTFSKLNRVRAEDMNSAVSAAMESSMDQTSAILEVSDDEVKELMKNLAITKSKTNKVLNKDMNLQKILKEKLGGDVIDDKMIESLMDTISAKFERFQDAKSKMVLANNSEYAKIETKTLEDISNKVGQITDLDRKNREKHQMSWAKKVSSADVAMSDPLMEKLGEHKNKFMVGFHIISVIAIIGVRRSFANRNKKKRIAK